MAKGSGLLFFLLLTVSLLFPKTLYPSDELNIPTLPSTSYVNAKLNDVIVSQRLVDGYYLDIPKAGIFDKIQDRVDPFNIYAYMPVIYNRVAQASGTGKNLTYLFAHSSSYVYKGTESKAIFANLNNLIKGDQIILNKYGQIKKYQVVSKKIVHDVDLWPLTQKPKEETLVLQTCWPLNSLTTRLIVTAKPIEVIAAK